MFTPSARAVVTRVKQKDKIVATGGTIHFNGDYKIHVFDASGTFSVTSINDGTADSGVALVDGGYGGDYGNGVFESSDGANGGNGGNGGSYRITTGQFTTLFASAGNYTVTIGAPGGGATSVNSWTSNTSGGTGGTGGSGGTSLNGNIGLTGGNGGVGGSVMWIGAATTYLGRGGGGGGGGGAAFNYAGGSGGQGGGSGGSGGSGDNGSGGQNGSNGQNGSDPGSVYGGGDGGGGGGGGGSHVLGESFGGDPGLGGAGILLIRYKFQ